MGAAVHLADLVAAWLPAQRWFAGKGRPYRLELLEPIGVLSERPYRSAVFLALVRYADGSTETYQVPLVCRPERTENLAHALLGELVDGATGQLQWWYDALHDREVTGAWLRHLAASARPGRLAFHRSPGVTELPTDAPSLVLTVEQSNTSLVYGDAAVLKVLRRLSDGVNPDIEVHGALARSGADRHVARMLGHVTAQPDGAAEPMALAILQEFFRSAIDGWELAKTSVQDLIGDADHHPDEAGGDFAAEAGRLGAAVAELHADLAAVFGTGRLDGTGLARLAAGMAARLDDAIRVVPTLSRYARALHGSFRAVAEHPGGVPVQRVHGDLHLGQVLRTDTGWVVVDFEGEPARPLAERRAPASPLRDVAGMLRSFDYAGRHLLRDQPAAPLLDERIGEWVARNRTAFCRGYAGAAGTDPCAAADLLHALEIDKAVYEVVYEARNRPDWLPIPLSAVARLAGADLTQYTGAPPGPRRT